jgi:hypothetical protein
MNSNPPTTHDSFTKKATIHSQKKATIHSQKKQQQEQYKKTIAVVMPKEKKEPTVWEIAKPHLHQAILDKTIPFEWSYQRLWTSNELYQAVPYKNFVPDYKRLKESTAKNQDRAERDAKALATNRVAHPIVMHPHNFDEPHWDGSETQRELMVAIDEGLHKRRYKPAALRNTKASLQFFSVEKFGKHVPQEVSLRRTKEFGMIRSRKGGRLLVETKAGVQRGGGGTGEK